MINNLKIKIEFTTLAAAFSF